MGWLFRFITSSIGKKQFMAMTGFCFMGFLVAHLAGNLSILYGPESLTAYADKLHSLGPVITLAELGLIALAIVHVSTGLWLFIGNLTAWPERYAVSRSAGGKTISSRTMPYTGLLILAFVVIHLLNFLFADMTDTTLGEVVYNYFKSPAGVVFYVGAVIIVGFHVRHGFWSAFQTVGANHPKYMPAVQVGSIIFAVALALGFGSLPVFVLLFG
jgi:succinate dehydrogenase / fumarate reductase cytochrome b subunit